jgi:hypothetical protein
MLSKNKLDRRRERDSSVREERMLGRQDQDESQLFYEFDLNDVNPKDHLRRINVFVTAARADLHRARRADSSCLL